MDALYVATSPGGSSRYVLLAAARLFTNTVATGQGRHVIRWGARDASSAAHHRPSPRQRHTSV